MSFAKTIEYVEAQAREVANRNGHWTARWQRNWIVTHLIKMHHWQALEEFLARPDEPTYEERVAAQAREQAS